MRAFGAHVGLLWDVAACVRRTSCVHWSIQRGLRTSRTLHFVSEPMLIVTQVAPYADGPAGVHGVLAQATTALCQLAEIAGLSPVVVDDVRDLSPHQLGATGVLALFTIGETPFSPAQKRRCSTRGMPAD